MCWLWPGMIVRDLMAGFWGYSCRKILSFFFPSTFVAFRISSNKQWKVSLQKFSSYAFQLFKFNILKFCSKEILNSKKYLYIKLFLDFIESKIYCGNTDLRAYVSCLIPCESGPSVLFHCEDIVLNRPCGFGLELLVYNDKYWPWWGDEGFVSRCWKKKFVTSQVHFEMM